MINRSSKIKSLILLISFLLLGVQMVATYYTGEQAVPAGQKITLNWSEETSGTNISFELLEASNARVIIDDLGKKNPVSVPLPGKAIKFLEIGTGSLSYSRAEITIRYSDAELEGVDESTLGIYHWNGSAWEHLPTKIDRKNKTLIATTIAFSPFGVAGNVTYRYLPSNGVTIATGVITNWGCAGINGYAKSELTNGSGSGCSNADANSNGALDPAIDMFLNTAYTVDTNVQGNWYFGHFQERTGSPSTITIRLIYVYSNGTAIALSGTASQALSASQDADFNISIAGISGTVPAGTKLGLRISTSADTRIFVGDSASTSNSQSGYFSVTDTPIQNFNLSGYVTNQSSGLPLSGATVQTNTSLTTTTDASGFYNFTGLSNGTYIVNASLTGYGTNSTNATINGTDVTNINISLPPVPTYTLSGYVANQSGGAAISGAGVTTNTSLTNTTDSAGFYSFTVSNGTYLITASKTGYSDSSTTVTVNGTSVTNTNISLSPLPAASIQSIKVVTNRLVVLDDPSGWDGGYATYSITNSGNQWSGESTTIRWYALLMNSSGRAAQNVTVTSKLLFPNGTIALTTSSSTNSFGIAEFSQNMDRWLNSNGSGSEGIYTINASTTVGGTSVIGKYNFTYDEWGCGSSGSGCHRSQYWSGSGQDSRSANTWASGSVQNSPYLHAWDNFHGSHGGGSIGSGECLTCHRGFDGANRAHSSRVTATPQYSAGIHYGKSGAACTDCHTTFNSGTMPIKQCYNCHPEQNNNLTVMNFSQTATSGFSYQPLINSGVRGHNEGQNISCIVCHSGMHNVSKPYNATGTSNTYTEYQQCTSCHNAYQRHNDSVSCTVCHSQDAHVIKVFSQTAAYINGSTSSYRGNCTNCHQNTSFLGTLLAQSKAGSHSGTAGQLPKPITHSNDPLAGKKWNSTPGYWTNGTDGSAQLSACYYCHGDTKHKTGALGRPTLFNGSNPVNATISTTTWCQQCHWQGASNYSSMVSTFGTDGKIVPPENTGNSTYGANQSDPVYFNHSDVSKDDASCKGCHGSLTAGTSITAFMHNVAIGTRCEGCHFNWSTMNNTYNSPAKYVNETLVKESVHANLSCTNCHTNVTGHPGTVPPKSGWKWCEDCHSVQIDPVNQSNRHNITRDPFSYTLNGNSVVSISDCTLCHNSTLYINSKNTYGKEKGTDCNYCHTFPDNIIE